MNSKRWHWLVSRLKTIEQHIKRLEFYGSFFRGFSTGSVLLIVSFGLAITFGLMGIINMAHGEFVAIGGYVCFMVQNFFIRTWGINSDAFGWYFVVSLPVSFIVAAAIGLLMEKSIIRFLYRRPLESLVVHLGDLDGDAARLSFDLWCRQRAGQQPVLADGQSQFWRLPDELYAPLLCCWR